MSDNKNVLDIDVNMTFKDILFQIRLKGYGYIGFNYSGGGDSGSIDDIYLIPKDAAEQDEHGTIRISDYNIVWNVKDGISRELHQLISDRIYSIILDDASDWYNNDGGGGTGCICTENGDFSVDHYVNIIEREEEEIKGNILD